MAKRVLAIGVGGSGKSALTILKERLEETYGQVPDNVVLLSLDTDSLSDRDRFAGTQLSPAFDERSRPPEFQQIVSPGGMTMDTVFADINGHKTDAWMGWLEHEKLNKMLGPAERDIRGGAQQRRPIGRTALFLRYQNPTLQAIIEAISKMYGKADPEQPLTLTAADIEKGKRMIFIIGSVAGGTGSGMLIDVANLTRHAIQSNQNWQSVSVSAVIVLPDAFASYTRAMDDPTNLKPNSYAALREFDRFTRVHSNQLPYMIRYAESQQSITWSTNQPVDHVYLVDTASRSASQDFDLSGDPTKGVFPVVADFLMAHIDNSLGDALATLRSNAGLHYDKTTGRQYCGFNVMNFIFPVDDVIESFSYRFVRELLRNQLIPVTDDRRKAQLNQEALSEVERNFTTSTVAQKGVPAIIQKAIVASRRINPETPDMSWPGLFGQISLSDSGFAEHYQFLQQSLDNLQNNLVLTRDGDYRRESFDEGATRLLNYADQFQDDYLGPKIDPDDPDSRAGGDWDAILGEYRDALRTRFAEVLDAAILEILNRRDDKKMLLPLRLPYAQLVAANLKNYLVRFKDLLEGLWREQQVDTRLRQISEELRSAITWMNDTRGKTYFPPLMTEPRRAQESFRGLFVEKMGFLLHQRIYRTVIDVLDSLGATERDSAGQMSVSDLALLELENWQRTFLDVDRLIAEQARQHEANRTEKRTVKVRRYLTNPQFEDELYRRPEHLPSIAVRVMGQVGDQKGLLWQRVSDDTPLSVKLVTTWGEAAKGAEAIARTWFSGTKGLFQVVRKSITIAERLATEFPSHAMFTNRCLQVEEPFLRYNPAKNDAPPFVERYVAFNIDRSREDAAREFLQTSRQTLRDQGFNIDVSAESVVACTVVEISRGFRLSAVESYNQCEPEYRAKLSKGRESIHLFPEEQYATDLEQSIPTLAENDNTQRALSPELVVAMGNKAKLRVFTLAWAYGLITKGAYLDPGTGAESTEMWLRLGERRVPLSQSKVVERLDSGFPNLPVNAQEERLILNALQNYMLKMTELPNFTQNMVERVKDELLDRGVSLDGVEMPFTLRLIDVNNAVNRVAWRLGPSEQEEPDEAQRERRNATKRLEKLQEFLGKRISGFNGLKASTDPRIKDMGTVMHLILRNEIQILKQRSG